MSMGEELALDLAYEGRVAPATPQAARLLALAERINALPDPEIDEAFAAELEARLLADVAEAPARHLHSVPKRAARPAPAAPVRPAAVIPLPRRRWVVRKHLVAAVAAAMLVAFPVAAGASALPGTPFYGVKAVIEKVELLFTKGEVAKGFRHIGLAERRLSEVRQLVALGASTDLVAATVRVQASETLEGAGLVMHGTTDPDLLRRLMDILTSSSRELSSILPNVSGIAHPAVLGALATNKALASALARALGMTESEVASATPTSAPATSTQGTPAGATKTNLRAPSVPAPRAQSPQGAPDAAASPPPVPGLNSTTEECSPPGTANGIEYPDTMWLIYCGHSK